MPDLQEADPKVVTLDDLKVAPPLPPPRAALGTAARRGGRWRGAWIVGEGEGRAVRRRGKELLLPLPESFWVTPMVGRRVLDLRSRVA